MLSVSPKMWKEARPRSACARDTSANLHLNSQFPLGMTLIELLVVIVILTTLVVAVVPILSPNNDSRKIREAGRGLHSYISLAQAKAARSGRPAGIAFIESAPNSGVALEVFQLKVPKGFAGFSENSRVMISQVTGSPTKYGPTALVPDGNDKLRFSPKHNDFDLYALTFLQVPESIPDPLPPRMFRVGDLIEVYGNRYLVVDDDRNFEESFPPSTVQYLDPAKNENPFVNSVICIQKIGQPISPSPKPYKIIRQPINSTGSPYQLPAGVAIDMQGSVVEGGATVGFPVSNSLATTASDASDTVGIMFSPAGGVSDVFFNGSTITNVAKLMLLLGRVENGGLQTTSEYTLTGLTNDQLEERQEKINWLNLDSRWLAIAARSGRVVVSENAFVTEAMITTAGGNPDSAEDQIEAAHEFIHSMKRGGGR